MDDTCFGRLVDLVRRRFGLAADAEVSLEANPGPDERGNPAHSVEPGSRDLVRG